MPTTASDEQAENAAPAESEEVAEPVPPAEPAGQAAAEEEDDAGNVDFSQLPTDPDAILAALHHGAELELPDKPKEEEGEKPPAAKVEPVKTEAKPAVEDLDEPLKGRISVKQFNSTEQRAMRLMHALNEGKTVDDPDRIDIFQAKTQLDAMDAGKAAKPLETAPSPVEAVKSTVEELSTNLKALRQQKAEAREFGADTNEIEDKIEALKDDLHREEIKLAFAEDRAQSQQAQQAAAQKDAATAKHASVQAAVTAQYPSIADKTSPLGSKAAALIAELRDPSHEDHSILFSANAAKHVAREALARLAVDENISEDQAILKYGAKPAAPVAPVITPKPAAAPVRKVLPAGGQQQTTQPKGEPTPQEILDQVGDDPEKALAQLFSNRSVMLR